jgi:hypothetical protein
MMECEQQCEVQPYVGVRRGVWGPPCGEPAEWLYTNGAYQRRECAHHASMPRAHIVQYDPPSPDDPKLTRISAALNPQPRAAADGVESEHSQGCGVMRVSPLKVGCEGNRWARP